MDALTVAKDITVAVIAALGSLEQSESAGELAGKVFKAVIKQVVQGIEEANK